MSGSISAPSDAQTDGPGHRPPVTLDLLSPWALAPQLPLADEHRVPVGQALADLLRALDAPSADALALIERALASLPDDGAQALALYATDTPLAPEEVQDYDRYFALRHVDSTAPGVCMVRSLLTMNRAFITLCDTTPGLDAGAIGVQKDGLRCQVHLLARVLSIELPPEGST
jgi:hypothetical protein